METMCKVSANSHGLRWCRAPIRHRVSHPAGLLLAVLNSWDGFAKNQWSAAAGLAVTRWPVSLFSVRVSAAASPFLHSALLNDSAAAVVRDYHLPYLSRPNLFNIHHSTSWMCALLQCVSLNRHISIKSHQLLISHAFPCPLLSFD